MSMKKAIIKDNIVENIIICSDEGIKGMTFPLGTVVWDCGQYGVAIGDEFNDGIFTRDGNPLTPIPTPEGMIADVQAQLNALMGVEE